MYIELVTRQFGTETSAETRDHTNLCPVPCGAHLLWGVCVGGAGVVFCCLLVIYPE